ncbi:MAG: isovaleryl-CoA dehydrogenase [Legionellales bacterium]|nr:isovaleryl-CoA dehydrogenase [Legionellales bacterium]
MNNICQNELNESQKLLLSTVEEFANKEIVPLAEKIDKENYFPKHLWKMLGAQGLLGITISEEFGGCNLGYFEHALVMQEISRASASIGLSYGAHSNLCMNQIHLHGTQQQKLEYLPKLASGEYVGALAMSETSAGSDVMGMQTTFNEEKDYFILNGSKMWITNGPFADVIIIYAKNKSNTQKNNISCFIVEKNFPGISIAQKLDKLGMRGSETCEIVLENCQIPKDNLLGEKDAGTRILMSGLNYERIILAAGPVGIMQNCLDIAIPYMHQRKQFGKPIGEFQLMQGKIADMYTSYSTSLAYLYSVAKAADAGPITRKEAASLILYTSENATQLALQTIQCLGGNGYINEYPAGRLLRDAKLYEIGAGTSEIRRMLIGREIFAESA